MQKYLKYFLLIAIIAFAVPQITLAAWWNPFSWNIWNYFFHRQTPTTQQNQNNNSQTPLTEGTLRSVTLIYPNPYDVSKNDTVHLVGGHTLIYDSGNIKPRNYIVAAATVGNLNADSTPDGVIGVYQGWGANRITPIIFVFSNKNGALTQIDYAVPDSSIWQDETQIKSLSINNGILSVNLLTLAEKDQNLPHYQQQATVAKTVQYKLVNGKLIEQQVDQTLREQNFSFSIVGKNIEIIDKTTESLVQKIPLNDPAANNLSINQIIFLTNDINFDGYKDLEVLDEIPADNPPGYDYFIYNPSTKKFEADKVLKNLIGASFDSKIKTISTYMSEGCVGQDFFKQIFSFTNGDYVLTQTKVGNCCTLDEGNNLSVKVNNYKNGKISVTTQETCPPQQ